MAAAKQSEQAPAIDFAKLFKAIAVANGHPEPEAWAAAALAAHDAPPAQDVDPE